MSEQRLGRVSEMSGGAHQLFDPEAPPQPASDAATDPARRTASGGADSAPGAESGDTRGVLSIGSLYDQVEGALRSALPRNRPLWVRGEIQHLSDHRSGHLYMDLVDPGDEASPGPRARGGEPTLKVKCWRSSWAPLRHNLAKEGIELVAIFTKDDFAN